jgi:hypothetical protein
MLLEAMKTALSFLGRNLAFAACLLLLLNLPQAVQAATLDQQKASAKALALAAPSVTQDADAAGIAEDLGNAFGTDEDTAALLAKVAELCEKSPGKADAIASAATAFVPTPEFAAMVAAVAAKAAPGSAAAIASAVSRAVPSASTAIAAAILKAVPGADGAAVTSAAQQGAEQAPSGEGFGGSGGGAPFLPGGAGGGGGGGSGGGGNPVPTATPFFPTPTPTPTPVPTPPPPYGG